MGGVLPEERGVRRPDGVGSTPALERVETHFSTDDLAQLVERPHLSGEVPGSVPGVVTGAVRAVAQRSNCSAMDGLAQWQSTGDGSGGR